MMTDLHPIFERICEEHGLRQDEPRIVRRAGGWFVVGGYGGASGPWKTEQAAELARVGDYAGAHKAERLPPPPKEPAQ